jgi:hypothetical protein
MWAEGKELSCTQLKGAYDHIMDEAHEGNYALILAQAYIQNGIVTDHEDGTPPAVEELTALFESDGEKGGSYALTRFMVVDLLQSLKVKQCEFVEKALKWEKYLHEPPYEEHAAQ